MVGSATTQAQDYEGYYAQDATQVSSAATAYGDYDQLRQRLDSYERELQTLRGQVRNLPTAVNSENGLSTWEASFNNNNNTAGLDAALAAEPQEVDIITKPTHKIFGRAFLDYVMADQDAANKATVGDVENRLHFRTVRIGVSGNVYENTFYKVQLAFGEGDKSRTSVFDRDIRFKDVYWGVDNLPFLGTVQAGHFKEPYSLEELTSSRFITFMERSLANEFAPGREIGIMAYNNVNDNENLTWYLGFFSAGTPDDPPDVQADENHWSVTGRIAGNPIYDEPSDGRYLVHAGVAATNRHYVDDEVGYAGVPELSFHFPSDFIDTGDILVSEVNQFNVSLGTVWGRLHASAEYNYVDANVLAGGNLQFQAGYAQVGWFLTGEHKGYKRSMHVFDRTKILEPFFAVRTADGICRGWGAWEVAYRYSEIDLIDGGFDGGRLSEHTAGVNWYLNDYTRLMFNYVTTGNYSPPGGGNGGDFDGFGLRWQVDF